MRSTRMKMRCGKYCKSGLHEIKVCCGIMDEIGLMVTHIMEERNAPRIQGGWFYPGLILDRKVRNHA